MLATIRFGTYKATVLSVVLKKSETFSLAGMEELRLRVFGNTVLKRIFGLRN
jgi:hypothetical protein